MKKLLKIRAFFLLFALLFALSGCTGEKAVEQSGNAYTIYYLNASGIQLVGSEYRTETADTDALVRELLDKMGNVPADLDCQRALPERIEKITYRIEGNVLYLYADANYALMNSVQEILCRAALTKTLTQIPDIEYLSIYCAEQPITDAAGNPVGMLSASDFVDSIRDVNSFERTELTLYFANETGDQLVEEKREVMQNSNTSLERLIVEQLIAGPPFEGAYPTIPSETKLLNISIKDKICYVNLDEGFLGTGYNVIESIPVYSIVNSLVELSNINKVQIAVNGNTDMIFREKISLSNVFDRNLDLVYETEELQS